MKRKLLVTIIISLCLLLSACGDNKTEDKQAQAENHYFVDGKELSEKEYQEYLEEKEQENEVTEQAKGEAETDIEEKHTDSDKVFNIFLASTYSVSDSENELEITLNSVDFEQEVHSLVEDTNMFSQYFPDKEGETYIIMKLNIKNNGGNKISDKIFTQYNNNEKGYNKITVTFDDKYNYDMQQLDTQNIAMSPYWRLEPLKEQEVYFFQSVPDDVVSMPYIITFKVGDNETVYSYTE